MFQGILGPEVCEEKEKDSIFRDFNLDVCISAINRLVKGQDLQMYYRNMPKERETTEYRRKITGDFRKKAVRDAFARYTKDIERAQKYERESRYNNQRCQREKWHLDAISEYLRSVERLHQSLAEVTVLSEEMQELLAYLRSYLRSEVVVNVTRQEKQLQEEMNVCSVTFSLQKNKVVIEEETDKQSFGERMAKAFRILESAVSSTGSSDSQEPSLFEKNLAERVVKRQGWGDAMEELMKFSMDDVLCRLAKEASYYLAFFDFADAMQERGYSFCMPESGNKIGICAGYDLAMAVESDRPVVANDFHMDDGEYFCVITGANGGGKTTFARMIGQILYFDRMGLLVPCDRAVLPHYENIFSHFSNEESEMSGRGKLVEELERLQPMMTAEQTDSFVILNELFTTAATLDAGIMGKKVLEHFMKNNCHGIYVTHIQSLAEERDGIVSMVAELEKDHHTRSFKITRKPAKEGEYEDSIITRYHMTYEQMREVIGRGN